VPRRERRRLSDGWGALCVVGGEIPTRSGKAGRAGEEVTSGMVAEEQPGGRFLMRRGSWEGGGGSLVVKGAEEQPRGERPRTRGPELVSGGKGESLEAHCCSTVRKQGEGEGEGEGLPGVRGGWASSSLRGPPWHSGWPSAPARTQLLSAGVPGGGGREEGVKGGRGRERPQSFGSGDSTGRGGGGGQRSKNVGAKGCTDAGQMPPSTRTVSPS